MSSDGHRLRESWSNALNDALAAFRGYLTSTQSSTWKRVPIPARQDSSSTPGKGKGKEVLCEPRDIAIHRRTTKTGDVYRVVADIPLGEGTADLDAWKAILMTPELRQEWDPAVESSSVLEMFDPSTRIVKTKFTLGWPANPRDAVMISRTFSDASTIIDISTSLPRSQDEPSYLRPAPPYVRSHVNLFAWCVQVVPPSSNAATSEEGRSRRSLDGGKVRLTCFWQHDLRTLWNIGNTTSLPQQLSAMVLGLSEAIKKHHAKVTILTGYGQGISIERVTFEIGRDALTIDYTLIPEEQTDGQGEVLHGLDELHALKERRRLKNSVEILLPSSEGWDIRISTRASSDAVAQVPWSTVASRITDDSQYRQSNSQERISFKVRHSDLPDDHSSLKVKLVAEYSGVIKGVRLNGLPHSIEDTSSLRDPQSFSMSNQLIQDASSAANISVHTASTVATADSGASSSSTSGRPSLLRTNSNIPRTPALDKSLQARVRRSYIYFSSLLQEPEAKWKRNTEYRGVTVTQLDSIDPTLVVYKAESTFVGIGLWDLYSAVVTPGARAYWDKLCDGATLLEDVNELSELWHYKTKPAWPVNGRDSVVLKTVYKSPTTVHVFSFSVDDSPLFPNLPPVDQNIIRTQVDLQGWAIEALSPTTTQLTLLEQSDPKGWSGKSTIPQQMISYVAGIGEFAIKCGGPPIVTRLGGARANSLRYDHERSTFRVEYSPSNSRRLNPMQNVEPQNHSRSNSVDSISSFMSASLPSATSANELSSSVELELRCDADTWASSLDIVIDPPPQSINCLRRHRLSSGGGGLWLTVGHDIAFNDDERLHAIVRKAPFTTNKEKGIVMVNGKRIPVDVEELPESEVKSLSKQKRVKPVRIPLDQPPVLGVIRRRRQEWSGNGGEVDSNSEKDVNSTSKKASIPTSLSSSIPKVPSPLSTFFTSAMESARSTTQQAVAAFTPAPVAAVDTSYPPSKEPMSYVLDALSFAQHYHTGSFRDNWSLITDKGMSIFRRPSPEISPSIPVHRGEKVVEGMTAEDVAAVVFSYDCRKRWDDRFDSVTIFTEYGADAHTAFLVSRGGFPFRDRGFLLASLMARGTHTSQASGDSAGSSPGTSGSSSDAIYCISASFNPDSAASFAPTKYNSYVLPIGRVYIDAWILETLDPYTAENYAIPSTRCTRLVAYDYAGSIPVAVNSMINSALPRSVLAVETYLKGFSPFPEMRLPSVGFRVADVSTDITSSASKAWALRRFDSERILLNSKLLADEKIFCANVLVSNRSSDVFTDSPTKQMLQANEDFELGTPTPVRTALPGRPESPTAELRPRSAPSRSPTRRHRRISSTSVAASPPGAGLDMRSISRETMRASSSAFVLGRDARTGLAFADFVLAELVIDTRTFDEGYEVVLSSRVDDARFGGGKPLSLSRFDEKQEGSSSARPESYLPIAYTVNLLPPSPLYASGSPSEAPTRHLLRLTLPTAQYATPSIDDPLTGETRSAPPKPGWLRDLEDQEKIVSARIEVRPLPVERRKKGKKVVCVDGMIVNVGPSEREGRSSEGVAVLERVRADDETNPLPAQLSVPLAVADHLYDQSLVDSKTPPMVEDEAEKSDAELSLGKNEERSETPEPAAVVEEKPLTPAAEANRSLFGLFNAYSEQFLRFTSTAGASLSSPSPNSKPDGLPVTLSPSTGAGNGQPLNESQKTGDTKAGATLKDEENKSETHGPAAIEAARMVVRSATEARFSISTLICAMLIAFLVGSLLRSLLSPADFIYVVRDLDEVGEGVQAGGGHGELASGWREIKRLLEVKYIVGGWDFQVAVVRRH